MQHGRGLAAELGLGGPFHQVAHQGLGHTGVDVVHRHVIAVVGSPAQGQLGQIARAHDQAAHLVGHVHQDLRSLPRLGVFVGHVVHGLVVADVAEVLAHRVDDGNRAQGDAQRLGQLHGVAPVRLVVPKPGMVMATMPARGRSRMSKALAVTSSASVESSPPETPIVTWRTPVCFSRLASAVDWMAEDLAAVLARRRQRVETGTKGVRES